MPFDLKINCECGCEFEFDYDEICVDAKLVEDFENKIWVKNLSINCPICGKGHCLSTKRIDI